MRALAISDLHFGAWTGDPVLSREFARERLAPLLDDIDELVLLGDVFDFLFSSVDHAVAQADPFFELVQRRLQGKRVVLLATPTSATCGARGPARRSSSTVVADQFSARVRACDAKLPAQAGA